MNIERFHLLNNHPYSTKEAGLWATKDTPLQKVIIEAYKTICLGIARVWQIDFNQGWKRFPSDAHIPSTEPGVDKFIYMNFCNIKLVWGKFGYTIVLTIPQESLFNGSSLRTNKMMQIALDAVKHEPGEMSGLYIEDRLQFKITNDVKVVYEEKVTERLDKENRDFTNKKLKIEG